MAALAAPASGSSAGTDSVAASAYVAANYRLVHAEHSNLSASLRGMTALAQRISAECAGSAGGEPAGASRQSIDIGAEELGAVLVAASAPDHLADARFVNTVKKLDWPNANVGRAARGYLRTITEETSLTEPNICQDVAAWRASGFSTVTAATQRFVRRFRAAVSGPQEVPPKLLAPYEGPADRTTVKRTARLERQIGERLGVASLSAAAEISKALGG